jgi:signal peptidase I
VRDADQPATVAQGAKDEASPRPWLVGLVSLFFIGVGHAYLGHLRRGIAAWLAVIAVALVWLVGILVGLAWAPRATILVWLPLGVAIVVGLQLYFARDAVHLARRASRAARRPLLACAFLAALVVLTELIVEPTAKALSRAYKVPAGSMIPTLLIGDHVLTDGFTFGPRFRLPSLGWTLGRLPAIREPRAGEIVIFDFPKKPAQAFIKRVVAVAGDTVEMRDERLYVNGVLVREPFATYERGGIPVSLRFGPTTVPTGSVFVMGDNRDSSYDSRFWGPVPLDNVTGVARAVYWSWDAEHRSVRWNRLGQPLP